MTFRPVAILALSVCALASASAMAAEDRNTYMKAFPPADAGMVRFVIDLPKLDDEDSAKVELVVGRTVSVDARNRFFFGGKIERETIKGWGFDRYIVRTMGPMGGTLMAVDPNEPKVDRFVGLGGGPFLVRYNSRLPIVVYVPKDAEVRWRAWKADGTLMPARQG
jgi:ecotin